MHGRRSVFSGAATPEELIAACSELNMPAMALLDNDAFTERAISFGGAEGWNKSAHWGGSNGQNRILRANQKRASRRRRRVRE